jgi:3-hydroxyisobutyrate dehydrogenase-like beta-hydroxyacid dehydrogenase
MMSPTKNAEPAIGLIGAGTMGRAVVRRLVDAGRKVVAYDIVATTLAAAVGQGADAAVSAEEVGRRCDIILLSLPGPRQIEAALTSEAGLLRTVSHGRSIIDDLSTVDPDSTRRMAAAAAERGADYLDAPVLGRPQSVGKWTLPVGGSEAAFDRCRPVLELIAARVVRIGDSGCGNVVKLLNQLMFSTINGITAEVMAVATRSGVPARVVFDTIANSGAATVSGLFRETGSRIVEGSFGNPVFTVELLCKDAGLAIAMARGCGVTPAIAERVQELNERGKAAGLAAQDTSALVKLYQEGTA